MCSGKFFDSSMFALCSQPTADVLSPSAKKQSSLFSLVLIATHTEIRAATNSRELLLEWQATVSSGDN
jgi:hypothetical protein